MRLFHLLSVSFAVVCFVLLWHEGDCRSISNRSARASNRSESKRLKKQGKKIRKSFAKSMEQMYMSMCTDCFARMQQALVKCESVYERLQLEDDKVTKCKKAASNMKSRSLKKKKSRNELTARNQTDDQTKGWKQLYAEEEKTLSCLLKEVFSDKKYESVAKDEVRKQKNTLMQEVLQEKKNCIQKALKQ